jgi:hypothetical protein
MTRRVRGHRNPPPSYPTPEGMRLAVAALSSERNKVAGHLETIVVLEAKIAALEAELDCAAAPAPVDIDAARARCSVVSERIARGLEERDGLLDYLLAGPPPPTVRSRLPGPPYPDDTVTTRRSVIRKLRIGAKSDPLFCVTCGQPMPGHISAHLFMGFYGEEQGGGLGELFVALGRGHRDTAAGGGYHGFAKASSLALQHGCPAKALVKQMRYQHDLSGGHPYGPDGQLPGPRVTSLTDWVGLTIERVLVERGVMVVEPELTASNEKET